MVTSVHIFTNFPPKQTERCCFSPFLLLEVKTNGLCVFWRDERSAKPHTQHSHSHTNNKPQPLLLFLLVVFIPSVHRVFGACQQILIAPHTLLFPLTLHALCHRIACVLIRPAKPRCDALLTGAAGSPRSRTHTHGERQTTGERARARCIKNKWREEARCVNF